MEMCFKVDKENLTSFENIWAASEKAQNIKKWNKKWNVKKLFLTLE